MRDTLGWTYYLAGKYYQAHAELEYAFQELPQDANVAFHKGANDMKLQRYADALKNLNRALELSRQGKPLSDHRQCQALADEAKKRLGTSNK